LIMAWNTEQHQHHKYPTPLILMLHEKRLSVKSITRGVQLVGTGSNAEISPRG